PHFDIRHLIEGNRHAVSTGENDGAKVAQFFHETAPTDDVLDTIVLNRAGSNVSVAAPNRIDDLWERDIVAAKRFGIDVDLVFADETPDAGDLRDAFRALQRIADIPVLNAAQLL